ncbi:acetyl-coa carboxylase [Culex quinquefasciatus]|uniref:Acetyl-coa carboxylase n=1 Tax=Culex quinquefasciatus TaxID=7176 RepID=B0X356_CULQU|nr:acetyl-coa carboxylase [Culex quinquefasciatus]|eukprot:XP_001864078.1 acetyl-coa carboxylase [Culex quinquefasciatus]
MDTTTSASRLRRRDDLFSQPAINDLEHENLQCHQRIGEGAVEVTVFDKDLYEKRSKYINKPCKTAEGGDDPEQVSSASSIPSCCSTPSSGHRESGQDVYPPHTKVEVLKIPALIWPTGAARRRRWQEIKSVNRHQRIGEGAVEVTVFDKDLYEKRSKYINKPCKTAEGGDDPEQVSSASSIPSCCSTPSSGHRESGQDVYPPHTKVEVLKIPALIWPTGAARRRRWQEIKSVNRCAKNDVVVNRLKRKRNKKICVTLLNNKIKRARGWDAF